MLVKQAAEDVKHAALVIYMNPEAIVWIQVNNQENDNFVINPRIRIDGVFIELEESNVREIVQDMNSLLANRKLLQEIFAELDILRNK